MHENRKRLVATIDDRTHAELERLAVEWMLPVSRVIDRVMLERATLSPTVQQPAPAAGKPQRSQ